jgi:hypothetical protein
MPPRTQSTAYSVKQIHGATTQKDQTRDGIGPTDELSFAAGFFAEQSRNAKRNTRDLPVTKIMKMRYRNSVTFCPLPAGHQGRLFYRSVEPLVLFESGRYIGLTASFPRNGTQVPGRHSAQRNRRREANCFAYRPTSLGAGNNGHEPDRLNGRPHRSRVVRNTSFLASDLGLQQPASSCQHGQKWTASWYSENGLIITSARGKRYMQFRPVLPDSLFSTTLHHDAPVSPQKPFHTCR